MLAASSACAAGAASSSVASQASPLGKVVVIGGGIVGLNAVRMAMGMGADVTVLDISLDRLRWFDNTFKIRVKTLYSSAHNLEVALGTADLVIGAVLVAGAKAPHLVTRSHLSLMQPRSGHR